MSTADMYDELEVVVDHLNDEHRDTMLFVVRHLASRTHDLDATTIVDGRLTAITENGIGGMATDASGEAHEVIWRFEAPPSDIDEVRGHMFTMLAEARGAAGDDVPLTSLEQEFSTDSPIPTHLSSVVAVSDVNPHLRQITFGGLDAFESLGGDEFLYVLLPPAGRNELTVDESFSWTAYEEMSESERPLVRTTPCVAGDPTPARSTCGSCSTITPGRRRAGPHARRWATRWRSGGLDERSSRRRTRRSTCWWWTSRASVRPQRSSISSPTTGGRWSR
ncbi:MAG: DUF2470 domain-containing protein [Actinomycetota bacterium]